MTPAERQETLEHRRVRIEPAINPVMPFLKLFHGHFLWPKDDVAHVVEVPVTREDPIFFHVLLIDACSGIRGEDGKDGGIDLRLFAEIHDLPKN